MTGHLTASPDGAAAAAGPAGRPAPAESAGVGNGTGATAERLLIGVSVYREPADHDAVLFQVGRHDWTAAGAPGRLDPAPPYQEPADLADAIAAYVATGLLTLSFGGPDDPSGGRRLGQITVFVERPAAVELHHGLEAAGRGHDLAAAHRRAAEYWQWRAACGPPGDGGDLHDLLEARHHLLEAGETGPACALTEAMISQLHARGDLGREAALISDTLAWLPDRGAGRAALTHELGQIAQVRADHAEAERCYLQALDMFAAAGDRSGVSRSQHSLGVLAQAQGDYTTAELRYQLAAETAPADVPLSAAAVAPPLPAPPPPALPPVPALELQAALELRRTTSAAVPEAANPAAPAGPAWRNVWRRLAALAAAVGALLALGAYELPDVLGPAAPARVQAAANVAAVRQQAAAWVAGQVSRSAIVACDPATCSELAGHGVPAGNLLVLGAAAGDPLGSDVVVATSSVRSEFGARLASVYAPVVLASFGSGGARIEIRVMAPDGTGAYRAALAADLAARRQAAAQLLGNPQISATPAARQQLSAGAVDSRLLITLATLASQGQVRVLSFGRPAPGASGAVPLRSAVITGPGAPSSAARGGAAAGSRVVASRTGGAGGAAYLASVLAFLHAQRPPYLATVITVIRIPGGQPAVRIGYPSPSPLGLLSSLTG
ncbi:MAG TPA: tetratricopeptide repeat protein [Streptosporangiaceae bacterium]